MHQRIHSLRCAASSRSSLVTIWHSYFLNFKFSRYKLFLRFDREEPYAGSWVICSWECTIQYSTTVTQQLDSQRQHKIYREKRSDRPGSFYKKPFILCFFIKSWIEFAFLVAWIFNLTSWNLIDFKLSSNGVCFK